MAQRLRSEIYSLKQSYLDIVALAKGYNELHMVEDFLLACGKIGYSGPEMFQVGVYLLFLLLPALLLLLLYNLYK